MLNIRLNSGRFSQSSLNGCSLGYCSSMSFPFQEYLNEQNFRIDALMLAIFYTQKLLNYKDEMARTELTVTY